MTTEGTTQENLLFLDYATQHQETSINQETSGVLNEEEEAPVIM